MQNLLWELDVYDDLLILDVNKPLVRPQLIDAGIGVHGHVLWHVQHGQ